MKGLSERQTRRYIALAVLAADRSRKYISMRRISDLMGQMELYLPQARSLDAALAEAVERGFALREDGIRKITVGTAEIEVPVPRWKITAAGRRQLEEITAEVESDRS